jgi:hypothetical protein
MAEAEFVCMKCGSDRIIPLVGIIDQGQYSDGSLKAHIGYTNPEAWFFKGPITARLSATICGECGFTELSAANPEQLYQQYLATIEQSGDAVEETADESENRSAP